MSSWLFGAIAVLSALVGALLASRAVDLGMFTFGLGLIGFGVFFGFWLLKDAFDQRQFESE